jgi:hypothetical protein
MDATTACAGVIRLESTVLVIKAVCTLGLAIAEEAYDSKVTNLYRNCEFEAAFSRRRSEWLG